MTDKKTTKEKSITPLQVGILMLMPSAVVERTEKQFKYFLENAPFPVKPIFFYFDKHKSNSNQEYFDKNYEKIADIEKHGLDGLIITGANLEQVSFEEVKYWKEFTSFLDWVRKNVSSTIYSCWATHAALKYFYNIEPVMNTCKQFGIFDHKVDIASNSPFIKGMDEQIFAPHSRWRGENKKLIEKCKDLEILVESPEVGPHIIVGRKGREIYIQGHPEYDRDDIGGEYFRDKNKGIKINVPLHYFPNNDDKKFPAKTWGANGQVFYNNWVRFLHDNKK
ncbi:MAG: Homoserine O-succinyltransferase [Parcubacteria group bacterium GW2011_GWC1_35_8]|uniref:Probable acyltransferase n=2 Tax=Candidatus Nomuraibacteriota TaxID=1752729 RepID=A0A1F6YWK0_9BACT|nr:MAG: Homoserine O-succinyltransferase [Parcubacteria group bacterium GW2011_GWC1_35_8]KKP88866.1 MAG: Homoserine O-succinyltransferase [Candidatus Nomurabacteria bacterium GW2011_GWC2_35_8]OGJ06154.1 MAG: hypothetical protein A2238_02320 [Candidatus Nomurabacteria bacterium RIFOXYA2_FULL_35_9]OGJ10715.1 MAG: hypothetical protein A2456_02685 [Candidatus Nomurabacteria bacterium RIFOXYC2_FULL_36_19]OGJ13908.1 MAG: hypothetical protein A2554_02730 [Candidatus Nomurabacteria bacterium RIFOXYD2_F